MESLSGSVALVTGASSGIGEGIATMLAAEGVHVALVARRQDELQRVADAIRHHGGTALIAPADLRDEAALRAMVERTRTTLGPVDILVNSGGIVETTPIHALDLRAWDACLEVNLRAPTLLCAAVLPGMRERKRGAIVNIASEAGAFVYAGMGAYAVSKHALRVLTQLIQDENQEHGIKAWAICPGFVDTPMVAAWAPEANPHQFLRVGEVVEVVRFLLTQGANVKMGPEILIRTTRNPYAPD
ncbi:MAG TPA: SDR family oxidoreductase [Ktedonobacterales bacterium]|nr:SDR family oxidoreductase [Ktedonobacterales bacterium]